jgi:nucleoid-associated protein YgaU
MSRFTNRRELVTNDFTSQLLKSRGDKTATFLSTAKFGSITESDYNTLTITYHTWKQGDKLYKLATQHYGDGGLWWLIAWFNYKPIDGMYSVGDTIEIPMPVQNALAIYKKVNNLNV